MTPGTVCPRSVCPCPQMLLLLTEHTVLSCRAAFQVLVFQVEKQNCIPPARATPQTTGSNKATEVLNPLWRGWTRGQRAFSPSGAVPRCLCPVCPQKPWSLLPSTWIETGGRQAGGSGRSSLNEPRTILYLQPRSSRIRKHFTESQHVRDWKGPLWVTQSKPLPKQGHLQQAVS